MNSSCNMDHVSSVFFKKGFDSLLEEKRASMAEEVGDAVGSVASGGAGLLKDLAIYGTLTGVIGGTAYNIVKDNLTKQDPKDRFNDKVERIIKNRKREREDAKWMDRVRGMRAELIRDYKKMSPEEYSAKYNALVNALDERKA